MKTDRSAERLKNFAEIYERNIETAPTRSVLAFHTALRMARLVESERQIAKTLFADGTIATLLTR